MTTLLCLGYGYCAARFVALHGAGHARILGSTRGEGRSADSVELLGTGSPAFAAALGEADVLLVSAPPDEGGDAFLRDHAERIAAAGRRGSIVYLSTIGVYGDSGGLLIDEGAPLAATSPRGRRRIEAEAAWRALGARAGRPVAVLRLGGIYGPGRNAVQDIRDGDAHCIVREGQFFNRIHVDDIADAIAAAIARGFDGTVNVVDDEPAAACAPVRFAAALLGVPPPPAVPYEIAAASMSPMARSFWADNRRVSNRRLHDALGLALRYPTYREGLAALFAAGA
ncbi:NAD-dependent epimerase/dehydratase family protein [Bosea sp. 117]|uniref:NAD-dependent epimerase/dehydratase family protein n=1 Tax=Bosea sp. 117 TaxID=1125973 RepID=UPI0004942FF7|nr:NAD-dependent epimerase/dehydratase family protein [Bosea sp. 117]